LPKRRIRLTKRPSKFYLLGRILDVVSTSTNYHCWTWWAFHSIATRLYDGVNKRYTRAVVRLVPPLKLRFPALAKERENHSSV